MRISTSGFVYPADADVIDVRFDGAAECLRLQIFRRAGHVLVQSDPSAAVLRPPRLDQKCVLDVTNVLEGRLLVYLNGQYVRTIAAEGPVHLQSSGKATVLDYCWPLSDSAPAADPDQELRLRQLSSSSVALARSPHVVLTSYFCSKPNPQGHNPVAADDFQYLRRWYESLRRTDLVGIVFHDALSPPFVRQYECPQVRFVRCQLGRFSLNDERFIVYLKYLNEHPEIRWVLLTDLSDVWFRSDPFPWMRRQSQPLLIGRDRFNLLLHSSWCTLRLLPRMLPWLARQPAFDRNVFMRQVFFNAGTIGGRRGPILQLLQQLLRVFCQLNDSRNHNLLALNACLHLSFGRQLLSRQTRDEGICCTADLPTSCFASSGVFSGFPLNSQFGKFERQSQAFVIHK